LNIIEVQTILLNDFFYKRKLTNEQEQGMDKHALFLLCFTQTLRKENKNEF